MSPFKTPLEAAIAAEITDEYKRQGLSQAELAEAAGLGREALNAALNGRAAMKLPTFIAICERLGVSINEIILRAESRVE